MHSTSVRRFPCVVVCLLLAACAGRQPKPQLIADLKPTVLLVSFDGFRWDYLDKVPTPNFRRLIEGGSRAKELIPVYPSVTFPNHYTLVTGLYSEHHGITANEIWDPSNEHHFNLDDVKGVERSEWWGGEPLWVTAEKQGQRAASMFWVGSTSEIQGVRPSYWKPYDAGFPRPERVRQVLEWLDLPAEKRPTFLTLYFEHVDQAGHAFGPDSDQVKEAVRQADALIGQLLDGIEARGIGDKINVVVVSDHGMANVPPDQTIALGKFIDTGKVRVIGGGAFANLFPKKGDEAGVYRALKRAHPKLHVFRKGELPSRYRYRDHRRIAPIVVTSEPGWYIVKQETAKAPNAGAHGWDNLRPDMHGIFVAHGPAFRRGYERPTLENIHVYGLICQILSLKPAKHDGNLKAVQDILDVAAKGTAR